MGEKEIEERIKGVKLGKGEQKIIDILREGRVAKIEEIIRKVYGVEIDDSSKTSIRTMIHRLNGKIRLEGIEIRSKQGIGYYIARYEFRRKKKRKANINDYKNIKRISEEELKDIIRNLRK